MLFDHVLQITDSRRGMMRRCCKQYSDKKKKKNTRSKNADQKRLGTKSADSDFLKKKSKCQI